MLFKTSFNNVPIRERLFHMRQFSGLDFFSVQVDAFYPSLVAFSHSWYEEKHQLVLRKSLTLELPHVEKIHSFEVEIPASRVFLCVDAQLLGTSLAGTKMPLSICLKNCYLNLIYSACIREGARGPWNFQNHVFLPNFAPWEAENEAFSWFCSVWPPLDLDPYASADIHSSALPHSVSC